MNSCSSSEAKKLLDRVIATRAKDFDAGRKIVGSECKRELCLRLLGIRMTNLRDERARTEVGKAEKGSLQGVSERPCSSLLCCGESSGMTDAGLFLRFSGLLWIDRSNLWMRPLR